MLQECFTRVLKGHITVCIALTLQQYLLGWCYRSVLPECWKDTSTCAPRSSLALLKVTFLPTRLAGLRLTDLNSEFIFLWEHRVIPQCCAHPLEQAAIPHLASLFYSPLLALLPASLFPQSSSCPTASIPFPAVLFLPYCQHPFSPSPLLALLPASLFPQSSSCPTASIPFPTVLFLPYCQHPFSHSPLLALLPASHFPQSSSHPAPLIPFPTVLSSYSCHPFSHSTLLIQLPSCLFPQYSSCPTCDKVYCASRHWQKSMTSLPPVSNLAPVCMWHFGTLPVFVNPFTAGLATLSLWKQPPKSAKLETIKAFFLLYTTMWRDFYQNAQYWK